MNQESKSAAKWIWIDASGKPEPNQYAQFRSELRLASSPGRAVLRISVDTDFAAWVNGHFIACGQYTDFPQDRTFSEIDITSHLSTGVNVIAVMVYYCGVDHFSYLPGESGLWFEVDADGQIIACSDQAVRCRTSPCYRGGEMPRMTPQRGFGFHYDSSSEDGWIEPVYPAGPSWRNAALAAQQGVPRLRPVKMLALRDCAAGAIVAQGVLKRDPAAGENISLAMQQDYLSARRSWELFDDFSPISAPAALPVELSASKLAGADGFYLVLDLGQETCGFLDLELICRGGCVMDIAIGEHLDDLRVRAHIGGRNFATRYVAAEGRRRFSHYLDRYAGRYVQIHITRLSGSLELLRAGLIPAEYPVRFAGEFDSADPLCNRIWHTARRTLHLCMFEHYEDCPWREQALYANDARNQMLCGYYAFGEYEFARASLDLLARTTGADGYQELCSPMKCPITIPGFTMTWFLAMNDYLMYSGDSQFIRGQLPRMKGMLGRYLSTLQDGLLPSPTGARYWHFYDWAPGLDGTMDNDCTKFHVLEDLRFDAPLNFLCILALKAAANLGRAVDDGAFAESCLGHAKTMIARAHEAFWDERTAAYKTYSGGESRRHFAELVQSLAILAGAGGEKIHHQLRRRMMSDDSDLVPTTLSQSLYKFEAILLDESAGPWVRDRIIRDWSRMLFAGATSFWETLAGGWDFNHAASLCHGWSAIPVYFFGAYGIGIKPAEPGFAGETSRPVLEIPGVIGRVPKPS